MYISNAPRGGHGDELMDDPPFFFSKTVIPEEKKTESKLLREQNTFMIIKSFSEDQRGLQTGLSSFSTTKGLFVKAMLHRIATSGAQTPGLQITYSGTSVFDRLR